MDLDSYNIAIETSGRQGEITLGQGDQIVATRRLEPGRRHNIDLIPQLDALCIKNHIKPSDINQVYVSLGPGSFTGLRVALTTVKMLSLASSAVNQDNKQKQLKVVGIPSLDVVAQNTPADFSSVAVCLNLKRGTVHSAIFKREQTGAMRQTGPAKLRTLSQLLEQAPPGPLAIIASPLPPEADHVKKDHLTFLDEAYSLGKSQALWHLGRLRAKENKFDDPTTLNPLYIRQPEAVTLWNQRYGEPQ